MRKLAWGSRSCQPYKLPSEAHTAIAQEDAEIHQQQAPSAPQQPTAQPLCALQRDWASRSGLDQAKATSGRRATVCMAAAGGQPGSQDLLVVGPGVLGSWAGKLWRDAHPTAHVLGYTNTTNNHARLEKLGLTPVLRGSLPAGTKFPYVLFSAPPSGSVDYPGEVSAALAMWDSSAPGASFVFTGSLSVCAVDDGSPVSEAHCPLVARGAGPGTDRLLAAEEATLNAGGNVLRLVGLYHAQRGAHTFFLKQGSVARPGDYVVNLLHYEDAASMAVSVLAGEGSGPFRGRVFLGCDNHPITFRDMMAACAASPLFAREPEVQWSVPDVGPKNSKRADNTATRQALGGWVPKYKSYVDFMVQHKGQDVFA